MCQTVRSAVGLHPGWDIHPRTQFLYTISSKLIRSQLYQRLHCAPADHGLPAGPSQLRHTSSVSQPASSYATACRSAFAPPLRPLSLGLRVGSQSRSRDPAGPISRVPRTSLAAGRSALFREPLLCLRRALWPGLAGLDRTGLGWAGLGCLRMA